jgi:uncharacterized protein (DUF2235 family)
MNFTRKNIVLCSDGTGNRGGKGHGTNVWRLYRALNLKSVSPPQVAVYDEGVGTEDQKVAKTLGGALGFGLGCNIREFYTALVDHYEPGDRIYLFGFSRGAYRLSLRCRGRERKRWTIEYRFVLDVRACARLALDSTRPR